MGQVRMFAEEERLRKLSELGDSLEKLECIDWEQFRPTLEKALGRGARPQGGRPPFDALVMFKVLVLQRIYNLSDDQMEFQLNDRRSFARFTGIDTSDKVPDAKTIWAIRNQLTEAGAIREIFRIFDTALEKQGLITHKGTIIDATFVDAPRQRNTRGENRSVRNGDTPGEWKNNLHKLAQKDTDARWTKKRQEVHFGYKDHAKVDADSKLITDYAVTPANVHDSNVFSGFLDGEDRVVYADSAYIGKEIPDHIEPQVCERATRNHPLTDEQKESNRIKSKTRARVEHVFGFMTVSLHGLTTRAVGIVRASFNIGLTNLVYNLFRYSILKRKKVTTG